MKIEELKENMKSTLHEWMDDKVDTLFQDSKGFNPVSYYLKNGIKNAFLRYDSQIDHYMDTVAMFVGDEQGNVDADKLMDDVMKMFAEMPSRETEAGPIGIRYGQGEVVILLPENPLVSMLLPWSSIRLTAEDLKEIKELL